MDRSGLFHLADKFKMAGLTDTALRYRRVPNSDLLFWFGIGFDALVECLDVWGFGNGNLTHRVTSTNNGRSLLSHLLTSSQKDFYNRKDFAPVWPENDNHEQDTSKKLREHSSNLISVI